jgi:nicotinate phosphoribosyltransferase
MTADGVWEPKVKLSEQAAKTSTPGILQVRRFHDGRCVTADKNYNELEGVADPPTIVDPSDPTRRRILDTSSLTKDLLVPVVQRGEVVYETPPLPDIQKRTKEQLDLFHPTIRRLDNPHEYPVGLERQLYELKSRLIVEAREAKDG